MRHQKFNPPPQRSSRPKTWIERSEELWVGGRPKALNESYMKKARVLLRSVEYTRVQVAAELKVSRHTL
jgi:hypothetical protein